MNLSNFIIFNVSRNEIKNQNLNFKETGRNSFINFFLESKSLLFLAPKITNDQISNNLSSFTIQKNNSSLDDEEIDFHETLELEKLIENMNLTSEENLNLFSKYVSNWRKKTNELKFESKRKRIKMLLKLIQKITDISLKDMNQAILEPFDEMFLSDLTYAIHKHKGTLYFIYIFSFQFFFFWNKIRYGYE
jgi:molecular chaperone DnaK (HSP70)